jgi:undecaprenyl pyrophosphate phosphatase UppP
MSNEKIVGYEKRKVAIDLFKHITTISVGLIALIASLLQKFIDLAQSSNFILYSVIALFSAVICSVIICITLLQNLEKLPYKSFAYWRVFYCAILTILGFFGGVGSLVWLIIKNIA